MQKDFHYYVIAMLANHAGFSDDEARVIAGASQYVDDATESFPLFLSDGRVVESTMTAHYHLRAFSSAVQRDVYMCFHFPPQGHLPETRQFSYRTVPEAPVLDRLLENIRVSRGDASRQPMSRDGHPLWMYRLGIALHTFADSFAHQTFSGRHHAENDVGKLWFRSRNGVFKRQMLNDWRYDLAPQIGHAEIGSYVDHPYRVLRYEIRDQREWRLVERNNPELFLEAAQACLRWLCRFREVFERWDDDAPAMQAIANLLSHPFEKENARIHRFRTDMTFRPFSKLFADELAYDPLRWPAEAFETIDRRPLRRTLLRQQRKGFVVREVTHFEQSHFRLFHKAARQQRVFILQDLFW